MRRALAILLTGLFAVPLPAQQAQQPVQKWECRDMSASGNFLAPDETVVNGMACRPVGTPSQVVDPAHPANKPAPMPQTPVPAPVPAQAAPPQANAPQAVTPQPAPPATASDALAPRGFLLEDATPVHLVFSQTVSSATAQTGDTVELEVVDDVVVNGLLIIPRGSTAWATVTDAEHKRHLGRAGKLDINIDKVRLADGEKALLRAVKDAQGGSHTGAMTGAIVATSLVLLPAAPLFLFMHGKDITIPKGTAITAFTQGDMTLDANKFQKQLALTN